MNPPDYAYFLSYVDLLDVVPSQRLADVSQKLRAMRSEPLGIIAGVEDYLPHVIVAAALFLVIFQSVHGFAVIKSVDYPGD